MIKIIDRLPTEQEYRHVRHLVLQYPERASHPITDDNVASVFGACPHLESVVLSGVPDTTDRTIVILAQTAHNLQGINLNNCTQVTDAGALQLTAKPLPLQWIRLNGVSAITDATISAIARTCTRLVDLEACDLPQITPLAIRDVWKYTRKLRSLRLARCPLLTDKAFPSTPLSSDGEPVSETDPQDLFPPLILRHYAEILRILDLAYCNITDESVEGIIAHAPKIQTLILTGCEQLTDRAVDSVCKLGDNLDVLSISAVSKITDAAIVRLSRSCSKLRAIDVGSCDNLTDMSVFELASLSCLKRLSLTKLHKITDIAIYTIAEQATELERLSLSHCDSISLDAIRTLLERLGRLQQVVLTGVPSFQIEGVEQFSEQPPALLDAEQRAAFRAYHGRRIGQLVDFLNEHERRRQDAEEAATNILS